MIRWTVAGLIVVGLLVGIWMVWPRDGSAPTTVPEAAETTTSEMPTTTTTSVSTTTTLDPLTVRDVETVEQAEAILRDIYFGWFQGIYDEDVERIRKVVANEAQVEAAEDQFGVMDFDSEPELDDIHFRDTELLRSDGECLAIWTTGIAEFLSEEVETSSVQVLRWADGWRLYSTWRFRDDLWEDDCESQL